VLLRVAGLQPLGLRSELVDELVGNAALDEHLARRHADLSLVQERAERRRVDGVVDVRVREHDDGVVAAELEHDSLQVAARRLGELAPDVRRAGEVDPADGRVRDELVTDRARLPGRVRHDVQDAFRQAGLGEDLTPEKAPGDRRPLGWLEDDGVPERKRRRDRAR